MHVLQLVGLDGARGPPCLDLLLHLPKKAAIVMDQFLPLFGPPDLGLAQLSGLGFQGLATLLQQRLQLACTDFGLLLGGEGVLSQLEGGGVLLAREWAILSDRLSFGG
jgi:hypothetical protein